MTNAMKYGSLAHATGQVTVKWDAEDIDAETMFVMTWQECRRPLGDPPGKKGFGSKVIGIGLVGMGGVDLPYLPTGLEAE